MQYLPWLSLILLLLKIQHVRSWFDPFLYLPQTQICLKSQIAAPNDGCITEFDCEDRTYSTFGVVVTLLNGTNACSLCPKDCVICFDECECAPLFRRY